MKTEDTYAHDEALSINAEGSRVPTIFELKTLDIKDGWYWSASSANHADYVWAQRAWCGGSTIACDPAQTLRVQLVPSGLDFNFYRSVSCEELDAFNNDGTLPAWHPPLAVSMSGYKTNNNINKHITKDEYIFYLETKCCDLIITQGTPIEFIQEQTSEILEMKKNVK